MSIDEFFERLGNEGIQYAKSYLPSCNLQGSFYIITFKNSTSLYVISSKTIEKTDGVEVDELITSIKLELLF